MDPVGSAIQSSLAGVSQAERKQAAEKAQREREAERFRRALDRAELGDGPEATEEIEAIRSVKGNNQEESHEDRQQQDLSHLNDEPRRRLDLEG